MKRKPPPQPRVSCRLSGACDRLWFRQIDSIFIAKRIRKEENKFHLAVAALDPDTFSEISDLLNDTPVGTPYTALKTCILECLTDSSDRQLQKMLNELELGDKKPSQLLREMRRLAGNKATEEVLCIKWLALLPMHVQSVLKIFSSNALAELKVAADKLMESPISPVAFTEGRSSPSHTTPPGIQAVQPNREEDDTRYLLGQLIAVSREILNKVSAPGAVF